MLLTLGSGRIFAWDRCDPTASCKTPWNFMKWLWPRTKLPRCWWGAGASIPAARRSVPLQMGPGTSCHNLLRAGEREYWATFCHSPPRGLWDSRAAFSFLSASYPANLRDRHSWCFQAQSFCVFAGNNADWNPNENVIDAIRLSLVGPEVHVVTNLLSGDTRCKQFIFMRKGNMSPPMCPCFTSKIHC